MGSCAVLDWPRRECPGIHILEGEGELVGVFCVEGGTVPFSPLVCRLSTHPGGYGCVGHRGSPG
jgi:hypothetical protein